MAGFKPAVLIVDDDKDVRESLACLFSNSGYDIRVAVDGVSALLALMDYKPDVILSDMNMPRLGGDELLPMVRHLWPSIRIVAMSGEFSSGIVPHGVAADAFYAKGSDSCSRLLEILSELNFPSQCI
ncbi:response regulator [Granulicella sp. S190]|uniref:response regulator n=1 Tax=Granulicella sp. S190 TaxID=1747226 RepID=UPI00131A777E